jgi:hypothetical protein
MRLELLNEGCLLCDKVNHREEVNIELKFMNAAPASVIKGSTC